MNFGAYLDDLLEKCDKQKRYCRKIAVLLTITSDLSCAIIQPPEEIKMLEFIHLPLLPQL